MKQILKNIFFAAALLSCFLSVATFGAWTGRIDEEIHFEPGKSKIRQQSIPLLEDVLSRIKNFPGGLLIIQGHTDSLEGKSRGMFLSQQRAQAVRDYFLKKGIKPGRLRTKAYGDARPVDSNETKEGRARNRRVSFQYQELNPKPDAPVIDFCPEIQETRHEKMAVEVSKKPVPTLKTQRISKPGIEGVIFKRKNSKDWMPPPETDSGRAHFYRCPPHGYWTPTERLVLEGEEKIRACIKKYTKVPLNTLDQYNRQYVGLLNQKRKLLWVNFLRDLDAFKNWETKLYLYNGGSINGFHLLYDPNTGNCYNIEVYIY